MKRTLFVAPLFLLAACIAEAPTASQQSAVVATNVVINEFTAGTSGKIELFNPTSTPIDMSGWKVDDIANGGSTPKNVGATVLGPGGFLVVSYTGINVASADSVRLIDAGGVEIDAHTNFYGGSSITGQCFGRSPDGGPWSVGSVSCSIGTPNAVPAGVVLRGTIVTPDTVFTGEVRIKGDAIECVAVSCTIPNVQIIETNGIILPGLIDAHNHILFDVFDETDWSPPKIYKNHNQWTSDAKYGAMVDAKQWMNGESTSTQDYGCEMDKYGELKGLIAGTTSILGAANSANRACYGSLARTIDQSPNDLGSDKMQVATLFPSTSAADSVCANLASGTTSSYVIHIGEGVDATSLAEFNKLGTITTTDGCLYDHRTTIVHGTALGATELGMMGAQGMSLVWSPRSNVFLYGAGSDMTKTTNVPLALSSGINVSLAPDWSIGGSQNLLDELRFADQVDAASWNDTLTPQQLALMVTTHPAHALGLDAVLGSIAVGKKADLVVIAGNPSAPYDALLAARPADVKMTIVAGNILYGDLEFEAYAPNGCEHLDICGTSKFVCVAEPGGTSTNKLGQTYGDIKTALDQGLQAYDDLHLTSWSFSPIAPLVRCEQ